MKDQVRSPKLIPVIHSHKLPCFKEPVMHFFFCSDFPHSVVALLSPRVPQSPTLAVPKEWPVGKKNIKDVHALVPIFPMA